jgi:thymidylate kinase
MKSIIIEGPNGAGKSTLGKHIAERLGIGYVHAGPSPGDDMEAFIACIKQYHALTRSRIVLDRCTPISRRIYELPISEDHERILDMWCKVLCDRAVVVYCTGEGKFSEKHYYPKGHFEEIVSEQQSIRNRYDELMAGIPHLTYNWNTDSYICFMGKLRDAIYDGP